MAGRNLAMRPTESYSPLAGLTQAVYYCSDLQLLEPQIAGSSRSWLDYLPIADLVLHWPVAAARNKLDLRHAVPAGLHLKALP